MVDEVYYGNFGISRPMKVVKKKIQATEEPKPIKLTKAQQKKQDELEELWQSCMKTHYG